MKEIPLATMDNALDMDKQNNRGGMMAKILVGFFDDVAKFPDWPTDVEGITQEKAGELAGDLIMKEGKNMVEILVTADTAVITMKPQGEVGGQSVLLELNTVLSKMDSPTLGFYNAIKGKPLVIIGKDRNGCNYLMGDKTCPAMLSTDHDGGTTGTKVEERNQLGIKFSYSAPLMCQYVGDTTAILEPAAAQAG